LLFEQRIYTLESESAERFWELQHERGFELVRPIMERLMGYFFTRIHDRYVIVHWWRFDSFDDWSQRLHGLYHVEGLEPYFKKVRALLISQENKFLEFSPVDDLNPIWSCHSDWLPGHLPLSDGAKNREICIEMEVIQLRPGSLPLYWRAWQDEGLHALPHATKRLIGIFYNLVGQLHEVTLMRWHVSRSEAIDWRSHLEGHTNWQKFLATTENLVLAKRTHWLTPAPGKQLSPLFY
jgi:hypothetical protein